jgi:hypothetical protein
MWLYTWWQCSCVITRRVISYLFCPQRNFAETYLLKSKTYMRWVVSFSILVKIKSNIFSKNCVSHFQRFLLDMYFSIRHQKVSVASYATGMTRHSLYTPGAVFNLYLNRFYPKPTNYLRSSVKKDLKLMLELIKTN